MLIEGLLFMFSECGIRLSVSIAWMRRLKKMYTETTKRKATRMINASKMFFRICMVTVIKKSVCKIAFNETCFQILRPTKSGQEADKILTESLTKT